MSLLCSSTPSRQLHLLTLFFSTPSSIDGSTPLSVENYWGSIYRFCVIRTSFLSISLSIPLSPYLPNHSFSLQTTFPSDFQGFSSLGKFLISHFHAFHVLKSRFWGFSKLMSYCWNFWMGFDDLILKTSCIAFHVHYNCIFMHLVVCYTCCTACVLVGLDWAEPMMFFLLCTSQAHAFSCIRLYIQYISIYLNCWSFSNCLFLPALSFRLR